MFEEYREGSSGLFPIQSRRETQKKQPAKMSKSQMMLDSQTIGGSLDFIQKVIGSGMLFILEDDWPPCGQKTG